MVSGFIGLFDIAYMGSSRLGRKRRPRASNKQIKIKGPVGIGITLQFLSIHSAEVAVQSSQA